MHFFRIINEFVLKEEYRDFFGRRGVRTILSPKLGSCNVLTTFGDLKGRSPWFCLVAMFSMPGFLLFELPVDSFSTE